MKRIRFATLFLVIIFYSCSQYSNKKQSAVQANWELIWEENFEIDDFLDTVKWSEINRNNADWGNYMSSHPACRQISNGKLYLRGIKNDNFDNDTAQYLTGGIETKGKFAFQYGKIEINAKLENAKGAWPAIWMLADQPKYGAYPRNGEIDLMEHLNFEDQVYQTVHSYYTLELKQKTNPPYFITTQVETEDFVTYGMEWFPDSLIFTVNNTKTFTYPKVENVDKTQWPFDQSFYLMIDMQLGGSWVGTVDPNDLPVQMIIDWVRVYKEKRISE